MPANAPSNGNAKFVAGSTSGTATPASSKDTSDPLPVAGGKPDKKAYEADQAKIKVEIDALQAQLVILIISACLPTSQRILIHWRQSTVRDKIGFATKSGPGNDRKNILRAELDSIRDQQSTNKHSRGKLVDQIKAIQDGIQKKV